MPDAGDPILVEDLLFARLISNVTLTTSSTTLEDVTGLSVSVSADAIYIVEVVLYGQNAAGTTEDIKYGFTFPSGASLRLGSMGGTAAGVSSSNATDMFLRAQDFTSGTTTAAFGLDTLFTTTLMHGLLIMSSTAGTFQVQAAQNTSGANASSVRSGSFIKLTRV